MALLESKLSVFTVLAIFQLSDTIPAHFFNFSKLLQTLAISQLTVKIVTSFQLGSRSSVTLLWPLTIKLKETRK